MEELKESINELTLSVDSLYAKVEDLTNELSSTRSKIAELTSNDFLKKKLDRIIDLLEQMNQ